MCIFAVVHLGHLKNGTYPDTMYRFLLRNLGHTEKLILIVSVFIHSLSHSSIE